MMKIYRNILVLLALMALTGCAANYSKQQVLAAGSQVQVRSYQTRTYDTDDKIRVLRAVMSTLQDLGFVIDKADDVIGIVSATKLNRYNLSMSISVRPSGQQMIVRANAQYNLTAVEEPGPYQDFFTSLDKGLFLDDNLLANSKSTQNIRVEAGKNLADDIGDDAFAFYGQAEKEIVSGTYDTNLWAKAFVLVEGDEQKRKAKYIELRAYQLYSENAASTPLKKQTSPVAKSILPVETRDDSTLTAVKIRELISGNTASGISEKGNKYHVYHDSNGTLKGKLDGGRYDSGTWVITDVGEHCHKWKNWKKGRQECSLIYSIEGNKYSDKAGSIFVIQEGDQRSTNFLTDLDEQTALIVPPAPGDQPAMDSEITATAEFDLTGTYTSNVHRLGSGDYYCFNQRSKFQIELKQENNIIKGKFVSGLSGGIEGTLVGNKVKFIWYTARCNNSNKGEWTVSSDGSSLEGYGGSELKWKALKQF